MGGYKGYSEPGDTHWNGRLRRDVNSGRRPANGDFGLLKVQLMAAFQLANELEEAQELHAEPWLDADDDTPVPPEWGEALCNQLVELCHILDQIKYKVPGLPCWVMYDDHVRPDAIDKDPNPWSGEFTREKAEEWAEAYRAVLTHSRDWQVRKGYADRNTIWHPEFDDHMNVDRAGWVRRTHGR